ncbi:SOS response-associated peptidase family protein [Roseovarius tibetensis]|uniref:SOS response-associated peptidase family protein n=1 Tax=Roseovarius tibetensis TaxID=2685897 RepID=UPI003D7FCD34
MAGIWRVFKGNYGGDENREMTTSSMVTTTPNALTKETHPDRMPMTLDPNDYETWLTGTPDEAFALIRPFPADSNVIHQSGEGLKSDPALRVWTFLDNHATCGRRPHCTDRPKYAGTRSTHFTQMTSDTIDLVATAETDAKNPLLSMVPA